MTKYILTLIPKLVDKTYVNQAYMRYTYLWLGRHYNFNVNKKLL